MIWKGLYNPGSSLEKGTMRQLRNVINRTNVPLDPQKNMNAAKDFMMLLLHAHVIVAAETVHTLNATESVTNLANTVIANFVCLPQVAKGMRKKSVKTEACLCHEISLPRFIVAWI